MFSVNAKRQEAQDINVKREGYQKTSCRPLQPAVAASLFGLYLYSPPRPCLVFNGHLLAVMNYIDLLFKLWPLC